MIEELLHWTVKNRNLVKLGKRVEEVNKEFWLLDSSLIKGTGLGMANMNRARGLLKKIDNLSDRAYHLSPTKRFDKLVLKEFINNLFTQSEYVQFFFTKKYNKEWGVRSFLNYAFLPRESFEGKSEENSAMAFLEDKLRNINYRAQTKRENLMKEIDTYEVTVDPLERENMIREQLPRLRRMIKEYNKNMGFETQEQIDAQELILNQQETEKALKTLKNILGPTDVYELAKMQIVKASHGILNKPVEITEDLANMVYDLVFSYEDYCAFDDATKTIEMSADRFHFFKDRKTNKIRFYSGDLDNIIGHENYHRLQSYFSRFMPPGLRGTPGEFNITGRTITEGTATVLEENFMEWLDEDQNRRSFNLPKNDITIAKLYNVEHFGNKLLRLSHSLYHREVSSAEGKDYEAHKKLASISRVPVHADDDYFEDESLPETFYFAFYPFGEKYVKETLEELEKREARRLGTRRKARNFLKRNEPIVIQGLLTGNWGWSTHKDFFLNHYWRRARKYCD